MVLSDVQVDEKVGGKCARVQHLTIIVQNRERESCVVWFIYTWNFLPDAWIFFSLVLVLMVRDWSLSYLLPYACHTPYAVFFR